MSCVYGTVSLTNTVNTSTQISGVVKNELVGTNTRLDEIETKLEHIANSLDGIAKALQEVNKRKPHRCIGRSTASENESSTARFDKLLNARLEGEKK